MLKRETVYESRYLPISGKPPIRTDDHRIAACSRCGQEWRPESKTQYSPCCYRPRAGYGMPPQNLPARHPFRQPIPGDRLSVRGGATWREVIRVVDGIVVYLTSKCREECQCTLHSREEWGFGRTRADGRCPARVERRGRHE